MSVHRGTSNGNKRGGSDDRRRRREWLVTTYRADIDLIRVERFYSDGTSEVFRTEPKWKGHVEAYRNEDLPIPLNGPTHVRTEAELVATCRCYRCGTLLTVETVSPDRIVPGCKKTKKYPNGGTYVHENIRPACDACQSSTGGALGAQQLAKKRARKSAKRAAA